MAVNIRRDPGSAVLIDVMGSDARIQDAARVCVGGKGGMTKAKLIKKLYTSGHSTPFEHATLSFKVECPIFTARQIMRHRTFSYNEISGRYTELGLGYYLPKTFYDSKGELTPSLSNGEYIEKLREELWKIDTLYQGMLADGVSREQARMILPMGTFTTFYMTGNLWNWIKFLKLRVTEHAQYEVFVIAHDIAKELAVHFPVTWMAIQEDIFGKAEDYVKSRHVKRAVREGRFSRTSWKTIKDTPAHDPSQPSGTEGSPTTGSATWPT